MAMMTQSLSILARGAGKNSLTPGEKARIRLDYCMVNDGTGCEWVDLVDQTKGVFDPKRVVVVIDHQTPANFIKDAQMHYRMIDFSRRFGTEFTQNDGVGYEFMRRRYLKKGDIAAACGEHASYFGAAGAVSVRLTAREMAEALTSGTAEITVPESVHVELKGELPYGVDGKDAALNLLAAVGKGGFRDRMVEFTGSLSGNDRILLCGLASDAGAFSALFVDRAEGNYADSMEFDLSGLSPSVAMPGDPFEVAAIKDTPNIVPQSVFVGGCMSGRIEDLRLLAHLMEGKHCKQEVRVTFSPVDSETFLQALDEGIVSTLMDSGCQLVNPGCAGCRTQAFGIVDDRENLVSAGGCNWPGCAGSKKSNVYLTSVRAAAAAALSGYLSNM